jgi:uncharacterized protein (TIGR02145 family)
MKRLFNFGLVATLAAITAFAVACDNGPDNPDGPETPEALPERVELNQSSLNFVVGGATQTLVATVFPEDLPEESKEVTWKSDNNDVATVAGGVVTPVGVGNTKITVTTVKGNKTATCDVAVVENSVLPTGLEIWNGDTKLTSDDTIEMKEGESVTLTGKLLPDDVTTTKEVTWSAWLAYGETAENGQGGQAPATNYLNINAQTGQIRAVMATNTVVVTIEAKTAALNADGDQIVATCKVKILPIPVTSITGVPESQTVEMGKSFTIPYNNIVCMPLSASNKNFTATVINGDDGGKVEITNQYGIEVKGTAAGTATVRITATQGTVNDPSDDVWVDCAVTITPPDNTPTSVTPSVTAATVTWATPLTLTATVEPEIADQAVLFSSSDPNIAAVTAAGVVTVKDYGTATITIRSYIKEDVTATVTITAEPMGAISFLSANTYSVGTQVWSDAVVAAAAAGRQSVNYNGGSATNPLTDILPAGTSGGGTLFSWAVANRWGDKVCSGEWRMPTNSDYLDLSRTIGGSKHVDGGYVDATTLAAFKTQWNQIYGGHRAGTASYSGLGTIATYWASNQSASDKGYLMYLATNNNIYPNSTANAAYKYYAHQIRCIKN